MKIPQFFHENCSFIELSLNPIGNEGVVVLFFFLWAKKPEPGVINQIKYPHNTVWTFCVLDALVQRKDNPILSQDFSGR